MKIVRNSLVQDLEMGDVDAVRRNGNGNDNDDDGMAVLIVVMVFTGQAVSIINT